jgi:hypothetical protein
MQPPQTKKEVQKLAGHIAALNRFIVKLAERSLPFFSLYKSRMGARATKSLRGFEIVPPVVINIIKTRAGEVSHIICLCHKLSCQRSSVCQKGNIKDGQNRKAAIPTLFHFRGPNWFQEVLLRGGEDMLCSSHERQAALQLF